MTGNRLRHAFLLGALLLAATASPAAWAADYRLPDPWTRYLSAQGKTVGWADGARGLGAGDLGRVSAADAEQAGDAHATASGRPLDLINPAGWIGSGRDRAAVARLVADFDGGAAPHAIDALAADVLDFQRRYTHGTTYWQVGNEINSADMTASLLAAAHLPLGASPIDDPRTIPLYAEYVFAPAVSALRRASRSWAGRDEAIPIVLGSIAGARRGGARQWLEELLAYRLQGRFAPELAGTRVADHVTIAALHYPVTAERSVDGILWRHQFRDLLERWVSAGPVKGIWNTEELGQQRGDGGLGAATAVRVAAVTLSMAARRHLTADQVRVSFYGWNLGPDDRSGDAGMRLLGEALGTGEVLDVSSHLVVRSRGALQAYAFRNEGGRIVSIFANSGSTVAVLDHFGLRRGDAAISGSGTRLTVGGARSVTFRERVGLFRTTYLPSRPIRLAPGETLVVQ